MADFSFIANAHPSYIENLYDQYQKNPLEIENSWAAFFKGFEYAGKSNGTTSSSERAAVDFGHIAKELKVLSLIKAYRDRGHLLSTTNPIKKRLDRNATVNIEDFGLTEIDLNTSFFAGKEMGIGEATLKDILTRLKEVYAGNIGFEYHHIADRTKRRWIRKRIEKIETGKSYNLPLNKKRRILEKLNGAVMFERFLHTKYVGQKRFSLEGGESAIVALDGIINEAAKEGANEIIIGMAHRGRLNVLANIMGKTYAQIFNEFEGTAVPDLSFGDGDVKYHLGFSSQVATIDGHKIQLKLAPNPSHLEAVNPVVEGIARAKADILYESEYDSIVPILVHGDAAVAGQGVGFETVQMSQLEGYKTGGTIHLVINNQIGFTTDFGEARSSVYSTGVAAVVGAPVFHVNGDDPEAVLYVCEMAIQYRQEFNTDVFIDMVCYRRHGHNEGDDPMFTQPEMYKLIKVHPNPREIYSKQLIEQGALEKQIADEMEQNFWSLLQDRLDNVRQKPLSYEYQKPELAWQKMNFTRDPKDFKISPKTGVEKTTINHILDQLVSIPEGFKPLSKVSRLFKNIKKARENNALNWGMGELLAYGSLLMEGHNIRMSGQDVRRGTFSHRFVVLKDAENYNTHNRLGHLSEDQGVFRIYNSFLSEFAVLGFEYGYSLVTPGDLVVWEAQFGDFANGAQTMFDQFISSSESKWRKMSGLVILLPHGYEGQGPEHSSARVERFLQLCAEFNMTVANITLPANYFHLLRRQLARPFRKPLVVMTPKSLLRHPECVSPIKNFETGTHFQELLDDPTIGAKSGGKINRLLLCSGKIYFDLAAYKRDNKRDDVAIVRLEQLYPLPVDQLNKVFKKYKNIDTVLWVQEEPSNMGPWQYIHSMRNNPYVNLPKEMDFVARKSSASPATGFKKVHDKEQKDIVAQAFNR